MWGMNYYLHIVRIPIKSSTVANLQINNIGMSDLRKLILICICATNDEHSGDANHVDLHNETGA